MTTLHTTSCQRSQHVELTCQQVADVILNYVKGELPPRTALALKAHLRGCPDCVAFLATYRKTIQATNFLRYKTIPPAMRTRVKDFLRERITGASHAASDPA